jgi:alpha,alpha-trehalase
MSNAASIAAVRGFIRQNWRSTIREPAEQGPDAFRLPEAFVVPTAGPLFRHMFYWDTYFACEGLVRDGQIGLVRSCANNMIFLCEQLGFIPNSAQETCLNRSQPPVSSFLYRLVYSETGDREWLGRAMAALEVEHSFWKNLRTGPEGLAHYGHHATPHQVEEFYGIVKDRLRDIPAGRADMQDSLVQALAEAESGWDFNPRFDRRCLDFYPVDLNSLLYAMECNAAWFASELGRGREGEIWAARAAARRQKIHALLWDAERGLFLDYDLRKRRQGRLATAAMFYPLWCGVANPSQADSVRKNLPLLERTFGLSTCESGGVARGQAYQWDEPNCWPPLVFAAVAGLSLYGFAEEARRIAAKYVDCVTRNFLATGNLWEKYNAVTGGIDVIDEYAMPPMLGWTAGTFLVALEHLEDQATR